MKVYNHNYIVDSDAESIRTHPWTVAQRNPNQRYYDFKVHPELIPDVLEDFKPWSTWAAIQVFYDLVAWVNSPESVLESNDCAFRGVRENPNSNFLKSLQCDGRLMLLFRNIQFNSEQKNIDWLEEAIHAYLKLQPDIEYGVVGTSQFLVSYVDLPANGDEANGKELVLTFWCWGDSEDEIMNNLNLLMQGLFEAVKGVSEAVWNAMNSQPNA